MNFNGKYGYCDRGGITVIPAQFDSASIFSEGLAAVRVNGKDGLSMPTARWSSLQLSIKRSIFLNGRAAVQKGKQVGLHRSGRQAGHRCRLPVHLCLYRRAGGGICGKGQEGAKAGYIDEKGKFVIKPQFDDAAQFSEGLAAVKVGSKYGYIDKTGKMVIPAQFYRGRHVS